MTTTTAYWIEALAWMVVLMIAGGLIGASITKSNRRDR